MRARTRTWRVEQPLPTGAEYVGSRTPTLPPRSYVEYSARAISETTREDGDYR